MCFNFTYLIIAIHLTHWNYIINTSIFMAVFVNMELSDEDKISKKVKKWELWMLFLKPVLCHSFRGEAEQVSWL